MLRRQDNGNGWTGALLTVVQLVALIVLPLLHTPIAAAEVPSLDASGAPAEAHSEASCSVCRLAGIRYAPPAPDLVLAVPPAAAPRAGAPATVQYRTSTALTSIAARAPPGVA